MVLNEKKNHLNIKNLCHIWKRWVSLDKADAKWTYMNNRNYMECVKCYQSEEGGILVLGLPPSQTTMKSPKFLKYLSFSQL